MSTHKYLDEIGLGQVWGKIKNLTQFLVVINITSTVTSDENTGEYTVEVTKESNKTYSEIYNAYNSGKVILFDVRCKHYDGYDYDYGFAWLDSEYTKSISSFAGLAFPSSADRRGNTFATHVLVSSLDSDIAIYNDENPAVWQTVEVGNNFIGVSSVAQRTSATMNEIEEMCDVLGFQSVTIDTSDYEIIDEE